MRKNELIKYYYDNEEQQRNIAKPFTPDAIVYCKSNYIFLHKETPKEVLAEAETAIAVFNGSMVLRQK